MLAWCAVCKHGTTDVRVLHGSKVETSQRWFGEIVWAGDYSDAAFDETDISAGSGGRVRHWYQQRNKNHKTVNWQFTTADARIKLKRLYPQFLN